MHENIAEKWSAFFKFSGLKNAVCMEADADQKNVIARTAWNEAMGGAVWGALSVCAVSRYDVELIITVAQHTKQDIIRYLRIPERKIAVIYDGIVAHYQPLQEHARRVTIK
jgi:hypothetical protein